MSNERYINDRPLALQDRVFTKLFEQAEIAKYNPAERRMYEESRKEYWDYTSTLQTAEKFMFRVALPHLIPAEK